MSNKGERPPKPDLPTRRMQEAILAFAQQHGLTRRETEVLMEVCKGLKNGAIASQLAVSLSTVRLHLRGIYRKTTVADKPELILAAWMLSLQPSKMKSLRMRTPVRRNPVSCLPRSGVNRITYPHR